MKNPEIPLSNTDFKRIAVCGGSLGREKRSYVRGQLVDIGIPDFMKADGLWDLVTGLFSGQESRITPFLDFSLAPVRKPILKIEVADSQGKVLFSSGKVRADDDGFFSCEIREKLPVGSHEFRVILEGLDSFRQYSKDLAHLNATQNSILGKTSLVGKGILRILPESYTGISVTSDIDLTYLATDIHSNKGKISTLFETPDLKRALPGMPELYRQLRKSTSNSPLSFISASPHFFRRTMLATIALHGIQTEALHLKYLEGTIKGVIDKVFGTIFNPLELVASGPKSAWNRTRKFLTASVQSLFDQMSYKLSILLYDRVYLPSATQEILLGDNTESDYMIFTLYQVICEGKLEGDALEEYLYSLNFLGRDAITRDSAKRIRKLAEENIRSHGKTNPVKLTLINRTAKGPNDREMKDMVRKALPKGIWESCFSKREPFFGTEGALGMGVILKHYGYLELVQLFEIAGEMVGTLLDGKVIDDQYLLQQMSTLSIPDFIDGDRKEFADLLQKAFSK